ncbi:hypothetical protein F3J44_08035 [Pantoea sp. Tr-811]|uniref:hypothetical protein n=1 Tax=unclassified Pantoea TaxID=2630326 RepID=UPI00141EB883|nr:MULTISPECIES: hypothetical protein [unclassified Pantoea]NIE77012.1 hypothetical protein [Pantoea sp. Ap-967]NIF26337.1 hypothetical protein [Pantoea sp. Tr-811]
MKKHEFAGCAFLLTLSACSTLPSYPTWEEPSVEVVRQQPAVHQVPCKRRGCDNHRLIFDPSRPEPNGRAMHRDW